MPARRNREGDNTRTAAPLVCELVGEGKLSWLGRALEKCAGFGLQEGNEIDDQNIGFVLAALVGGEFALITLAGKFVDPGLRFGIEVQMDELSRHLGSEYLPKWID